MALPIWLPELCTFALHLNGDKLFPPMQQSFCQDRHLLSAETMLLEAGRQSEHCAHALPLTK
jgi:hypothetical protein